MPSPPPLSDFTGTLRQVDLEGLSPEGRAIFDFAFPVFVEAPTLNEPAIHRVGRGQPVETPYNYRRFAGGGDLPRGCYSTVCVDGTGDDAETLALELTYYTDPIRSGLIHVFDGSDPRVSGGEPDFFGSAGDWRPDPSSIVVAFLPAFGRPHPLLDSDRRPLGENAASRWFRSQCPISEMQVAFLEVPTRTRECRRQRVLDLRRPSAQDWLNTTVRTELPFTVFVYPGPIPNLPQRDLRNHIPQGYPWVLLSRAAYQQDVIDFAEDAVMSTGLLLDDSDKGTFTHHLLLALVAPGRGGSALTEAIATALRLAGTQGLVYPSARNDVYCVFENDEVVQSRGWCFVDYSAFKFALPQYRIIHDPVSWLGRDRLQLAVRPPNDRYAGSWKLTGLKARTDAHYRALVEDWLKASPEGWLASEHGSGTGERRH